MSETRAQPTVAVVDDDPIFQFTAVRTLQHSRLSTPVLQFANALAFLDFLRSHAHEPDKLPDVIFLDINMPMMDGWMFLEDFKQLKETLGKEIKIYVLSSSIDSRDIDKARENPLVDDYVTKPITPERFSEILKLGQG
jgi:CheY-like chemotaxis protein